MWVPGETRTVSPVKKRDGGEVETKNRSRTGMKREKRKEGNDPEGGSKKRKEMKVK